MNRGLWPGALAFVWWGLFPLYFLIVPGMPSGQVLAHRIVWSTLLLGAVLTWRRQWAWLGPLLRRPKAVAIYAASALCLSINWLTYIWSVNHGQVVEASLGYFITPLVNVVLGVTLLRERPRHAQLVALALAGAAVLWLTWQAGRLPWTALTLGITFGLYGLLRKLAPAGSLEGLTFETTLLAPFALVALWLYAREGTARFPAPDLLTNAWLVAFGPVTAVPLLLFGAAARRLSLTTLGLLQYIGPSLAFVLGITVFHEPFSTGRMLGFALIWAALAIYTADGWRAARAASLRPAPAPAPPR